MENVQFCGERTGSQLKFIERNVQLEKGMGLNLDKAEGRLSSNKVATVAKEICFISGKNPHIFLRYQERCLRVTLYSFERKCLERQNLQGILLKMSP